MGSYVDVPIVGVAYEGVVPLLQFPVHFVEENVGQQRRDRSPLRGPFVPLDDHPVDHHPCLKVATDQSQHPLVLDPLRQPSHQDVPVDPVEEPFQVHIDYPASAFLDVPLRTP